MKKITSTDNGGAPITKADLRTVFNSEIWDAMEALLKNVVVGGGQGIIVSGCVFTDNAGSFDMTAGIVYLDGQFMKVAAVTNQTFTKYIRAKTPVTDSRTFADGGTHAVTTTYDAELNASAGSDDFIAVSSLTSADSYRLRPIVGVIQAGDVNAQSILVSDPYTPTTDMDTMFDHGVQFVTHTAANAPTATSGHMWVVQIGKAASNGSYFQLATQVAGSGAGAVSYREYASPSGPWGSWTAL